MFSVSELKPLRLYDALDDGWRVVTHPISSPVCALAENYFAKALENVLGLEDAIVRLDSTRVRILMVRQNIFRRVEANFNLLEKKRVNYGRKHSLVVGGPFQGWIVASSNRNRGFLLARQAESHFDSAEFDRVKCQFGVSPLQRVPSSLNQEVWINEFMTLCHGSTPISNNTIFFR